MKLRPRLQHSDDPVATSWDDHLPVPKLSLPGAFVVVAALAIICFANSYDAAFVFDDSEAILKNADVRYSPLGDVFRHDFWGNRIADNTSHKSYRPLTVLSFRLNTYLAGGLHPGGFHVFNILLHAVVCVLFLPVASLLLNGSTWWHFKAPRASLLATSLFAVHPIHTESVAGVVGRADLLCAVCFLISFLCYARACPPYNTDGRYLGKLPFSAGWMGLSMILAALSVLCKEQGITVLGICSAFDILILNQVDLAQVLHLGWLRPKHATNLSDTKPKVVDTWFPLAVRQAILCATGLLILLTRWQVMGSQTPVFQIVDNPHSFVNSTVFRAINYNYIYAVNAWIMLCPIWLCFDWSMGCIPVITSATDLRIIVGVLPFWIFMITLVAYSLRMQPSRQQRLIWISLALLAVPFLPATNLLFRVGFVVAERVLYLSVGGATLLISSGVTALCTHHRQRKMVQVCLPVLILLFMSRSIQRSRDWHSESVLFEAGASVCPLNAKVHYNRAKLKADTGDTEFAIDKYRLALLLNPTYDQAMNNLANIIKDQGEAEEAERLLTQAVSLRSNFAAAWMNLGVVQATMSKYIEAESSYLRALRHRKKYPDCYHNLGNLYLSMDRHQMALTAWRTATLQKPTQISAWSNMILLLDNLGRLSELDIVAEEALRFNPREAMLYYNYASALGRAGRFADGETNFLQAIHFSPETVAHHANLGVLYHRWGKLEKADAYYERALQLDPGSTQTRNNQNMLHKKMQTG